MRNSLKAWTLATAAAILLLCGCSDLRQAINSKFPPVDEDQQRMAAINSTATAFSAVTAPTVAAEIQLADVNTVLQKVDLSTKFGVTGLSIVGDQQLLKITLAFHHRFVESDAGDNKTLQQFITTFKPDVSGSMVILAGLKNPDVNTINLANVPAMDLQLLPAISSLSLTDIKLLGEYKVDNIVQPLVDILNDFKGNISGAIARNKVSTISIPEVVTKPIDLSSSFSFKINGQIVNGTVSAKPIGIPYEMTGVAWRISSGQITVLIQVLPKSDVPSPAQPGSLTTFKDIDNHVNELLASNFDVSTPATGELVAVNKSLVAGALGSAVDEATPCAAFSAPSLKVPPYSKMISIAPSTANCRQDPTNCDIHCSNNPDTKSCGGNFISKKVCQAGKDAVNARIASEYAACLAAAGAKKTTCLATQGVALAGCQAIKQSFNTVIAGEVGNVSAQVSGSANAQLCLSHLEVSDDFSSTNIAMTASGTTKVSASFGFDPRRIVGRALCYLPATAANNLTANLNAPRWNVSSPITIKQDGDETYLYYDIEGGDVSFEFSPSLFSLLSSDLQHIALKCPIAGFADQVIDILGYAADIPNGFSIATPTIAGSQVISLPKLSIGDEKVALRLQQPTSKALVLSGKMQ
ncbi:hypothetical protein SAMN05444172_5426 [Burkholderia sp. GAS332]|nr:hypothetical protein SAMN05444172_5426 [Burkholderia sp. GAS332]